MSHPLPILAMTVAAFAAVAPPALAQTAGEGQDRPGARPLSSGVEVRIEGGGSGAQGVDESGLRYYVSRGEREMVEAEIRRLRQMYPGWAPPADLFGPVSEVDERPLWELYEAGDYDGVRARIASLEKAHRNWRPPAKLLELIKVNETRTALRHLESEEAWSEIVALAEARPGRFGCDAIDNGWRLARAHAELGASTAAARVYAQQIKTCDSFEHRFATLQKARARLERKQVQALFVLERKRDKSRDEEEQVAALEAEAKAPETRAAAFGRLFEADVTIAEAAAAEDRVAGSEDAAATERLGWIYYEAREYGRAALWFARAQGLKPNAKRAEGLALALQQSGELDALERLAVRYPEIAGPILERARGSVVARAYEAGDLATVLEVTSDGLNPGDHALRGWSLMALARPTEAAATFRAVIDDPASDLPARREAAYGLARATLAIGNMGHALQIANAFMISDERRFELHAEVMQTRAVKAFNESDYRTALALLEARRSYLSPTRDLEMLEAWSRYHLGQKNLAARMFTRLHRIYATEETAAALDALDDRISLF